MNKLDLPSRGRGRGARTARTLATLALGLPLMGLAAVRSEVDRTTVAVGEPFTLTISRDGAASGVQPDLAPLRKDFAVLGTEASSETSIVNGARSDRTKWIVSLQPLHAGSAEIPAIVVGGERTAPIELSVGAPSAAARAEMSEHAFIEADTVAAGKSPYVQQQVPYTVRLFVDGDVQSGTLDPPDAGPDAVVEQVGKETRHAATRHGRDYTVIERRYAISPERSGTLKVSPPTFRGTVSVPVTAGSADADPADDLMARMLRNSPFANDPMFRGGLMATLAGRTATRTLTVQGPALALDVRARPSNAGTPWLPAEQVTVTDSWAKSPPRFAVGEPVSRVITIEARGVAASQIPTLAPAAPGKARVYPESVDNQSRIDGTSIDGVSRQTLTYIPSATGTLDVPALALAWWDTTAGAPRSALLPARTFEVAPGATGAQAAAPAPQADEAPAKPAAPAAAAAPARQGWRELASLLRQRTKEWPWLAASIALVAAVAAALLAMKRRARGVPPQRAVADPRAAADPAAAPQPDRRSCLEALHDACRADDAASAAQALLQLARLEWPADPPRGLGALAERLSTGGAEIASLDRCLYGAEPCGWDGELLWERFKEGFHPAARRARSEPEVAGLYGDMRGAL